MADASVKTVRLPNDKMIEKFLSKQSNFSKAIRYLVIKYCQEVGYDNIEDLSVEYNNLLYKLPFKAEVTSKSTSSQKEVTEEKSTTANQPHNPASSFNTVIHPKVTAPVSEIPSCYQ